MMTPLTDLLGGSHLPAVTALALGLIVALHPCPLATNIAALSYMSGDADGRRRLLQRGLCYALGRAAGYSVVGVALTVAVRRGVDILSAGHIAGHWGERLLAPLLIVAGLYFIVAHLLHRREHCHTVGHGRRWAATHGGSFALGVLLSLTFCPESAIVFFGMVVPLSAETGSYLLPVLFAVATSLPVAAMAWCLAYSMGRLTALRGHVANVQRCMSIGVGLVFVAAGVVMLIA